MSQILTPGANAALGAADITVRIRCAREIDVAAYRLAANGKVRGDGDMVFYGQTASDDGSLKFAAGSGESSFQAALARQPAAIERIAFAFSAAVPASALGSLSIEVLENGAVSLNCPVELAGRSEAALILGECYRRNGAWKFRFVAQGFNGGLKPLSEHFGVEIADDGAAPAGAPSAPPPPEPPKVNLGKVTLDKARPQLSLEKRGADFGEIKINLNWNRGGAPAPAARGFLAGLFNKGQGGVDLDLGAFVRLKNGSTDVVQALGERFGSLNRAPYLRLRGDDRTGAVSEGEWLDINGSQWAQISEVLVYAFIYEGVPNWDATDGVVTLHVQGQQVETRLTEGGSRNGMCAVARLINDNGSIRIERINRYFPDHQEMDRAFGWGFSWRAGSK